MQQILQNFGSVESLQTPPLCLYQVKSFFFFPLHFQACFTLYFQALFFPLHFLFIPFKTTEIYFRLACVAHFNFNLTPQISGASAPVAF